VNNWYRLGGNINGDLVTKKRSIGVNGSKKKWYIQNKGHSFSDQIWEGLPITSVPEEDG
jgi:hypothetical protein